MALSPGTKLGPYEIQSPLGAGGMGEVYRARDNRLDRIVAIKILPQQLSSDPVRRQRFEREAKIISSLNHPNICTLHDIGSQDGVEYLVMECVEGETLAARLQKGSLPLEQVLKYGEQIADGLDKAHRAGIVHRDLKPGNIMLTATGTKLLDFGLAKPAVVMSGMTVTAVVPASPVTQEGTIVGTFQYMSPEQVEGKEVDARSDIFALGAVLYEMWTGQRAFEGKSQLSVTSAILEEEPAPITAIKPLTPVVLDHAVKKCLAKSPDERWQSASDLAAELKWVREGGAEVSARGVAERAGGFRRGAVWAVMTLAAVALAIAATYFATRPTPGALLMASLVPPPGVFADTSGRIGPPQISPDGTRIAFIGCKTESAALSRQGGKTCSIWLRVLASAEAREVADSSGAYYPFWSPDGRAVAFFADGKLKRVAADGGPVQVICDAPDARGGSWGSSGTIIFAATRVSPILRVPADGGTPVAVTQVEPASKQPELVSNRWPHFLPDGKHFLYVKAPNGACGVLTEVHFASIDAQHDVSLMRTCSSAAFANGYLIYWRDGNLVAQPLDPHTGGLSGVPAAIVEHANLDPLFGIALFSVSAEDKLVYVSGDAVTASPLMWDDRNGKMLGTLGEHDHYLNVAVSPDGSRVVADTISVKESKIQILDARGSRTLMTLGNSIGVAPTWSSDGRQIYFISNVNGPRDIYVRAADGSGREQEVLKFNKDQYGAFFLAVSPDGKFLAYATIDPVTGVDIYTMALGGDRKPQPFLHSPANEQGPAFSPDGRWLAYESTISGRNEVYITPFPTGGAQYQVSTSGGERPVWRHDGKEIYYREGLTLLAVEINTKASPVEFSSPKELFELAGGNLNGRYYDVAPNGRFLTNTSPTATKAQSFSLLVNWPAKLSK
jgi:Tol biopolymer transport system component